MTFEKSRRKPTRATEGSRGHCGLGTTKKIGLKGKILPQQRGPYCNRLQPCSTAALLGLDSALLEGPPFCSSVYSFQQSSAAMLWHGEGSRVDSSGWGFCQTMGQKDSKGRAVRVLANKEVRSQTTEFIC